MANPNNPLAPGLNGAAPKGPRTIWNNPVFSAVLAIIMGFAMWIIVTVYIDPQGSTTVTGVPINYTSGASTYTAQGLDIVEKPDIEGVTVKVEGNSTIIGNIRSADIMVYPSYAGVSGAGKVTLRLQARVTNTTDFPGDIECTVESPSTIDVVFDEVSEKTVPVTVDASAVTISSGYMLNKTTAVPAEITLRGPTSELDQVSSIVAPVQMDGELADTTTVPATLELVFVSAVLALGISIPLGVYAGAFPKRKSSTLVMGGSILGISLPSFFIGIMLIYIFSLKLHWFPSSGRGATAPFLGMDFSLFAPGGLKYIILPALTLSVTNIASLVRLTRAGVMENMRQDYIKFARAKGVATRKVLFGHALKNALIPVITVFGMEIGSLIAFTTVTETIYSWPGLGKLLIDSINSVDRPVIVAYLILTTVLFVFINFVVDLLYTVIDPRIKIR